jgi:hypothetical protein
MSDLVLRNKGIFSRLWSATVNLSFNPRGDLGRHPRYTIGTEYYALWKLSFDLHTGQLTSAIWNAEDCLEAFKIH